ncbi:MAG: hypothetical protein A2Y77_16535 [Planctomycetes bacterium RBG_13_62_9]|nr:MAG: hypothetical protein A2Y77_16535 [Planctomycetes bacterium RBG_13_62_9]
MLLALAGPAVVALAAEDITGEWEMAMDFGGRQSFATLTISKNADGSLAGKWGSADLANVKFDGQKLTFSRTIRFGDNEFTMNYAGTLKDGKITGAFSTDNGEFAANGTRKKPISPVVGQWDMQYRAGERDVTGRLTISQKPDGAFEGKWTSERGESAISNVRADGAKLAFDRTSKFNDREFKSTFEGTSQGDKLTGMFKSERGEMPASGQRFGSALIGKWELTSNSDQGPRTRILTVYPDLTGRYESFGGEIPIKDLKLDGDQVTFVIEMGFGDRTFRMDFKGKLQGQTLNVQSSSERGTVDLTGKKLEQAAPQASAIVGTWEFTREGQDGTRRTSTLTIKPDMTGAYKMRDTEFPITELKVDGDQVAFKVTVKYNDNEVPMTFQGKVDGATLKGEFTSERGAREALGKKVN